MVMVIVMGKVMVILIGMILVPVGIHNIKMLVIMIIEMIVFIRSWLS